MKERSRFFAALVAIASMAVASNAFGTGGAGRGEPRGADRPSKGAPGTPSKLPGHAGTQAAAYYGVPLAPPIYFVNFMLLYMASPDEAANMPAYRALLPTALSDCLESNPHGCPYSEYALSFDDRAVQGRGCGWPTQCRTTPRWERLAASVAERPGQSNEPLGLARANRLAESLDMDNAMILTDQEYECTVGVPPRDEDRQIIHACIDNLTNSKGNTNIPLSSYGLAITDERNGGARSGDVQSLCAPDAPCLVFNDLFVGPLERIAAVCGWETKLERMLRETPFLQFVAEGARCQELGGSKDGGACIVEAVCRPGRR